MPPRVTAFTDTYLPTVNGVTYTVSTWRDRWQARGGRMDVVYPRTDGYEPGDGEHPVRSLPFPFYEGFRLGLPHVPDAVAGSDLIHLHGPFALGMAGMRYARRNGLPTVASYHTPSAQYAEYLTSSERLAQRIESAAERYERWFFDRADVVLVPSRVTRDQLVDEIGVTGRVEVVPNGVDASFFRPVDPVAFRERHDLDGDRPIVGYTGRHGYEKRLSDLVAAADGFDATVLLGGDGPARPSLEALAEESGADVRFLGFLDRDELPAFYSALDVFAFPSPVETEGLVALEAIACGTPVVGADTGALAATVEAGETGYHFRTGDPVDLQRQLRRTLDERIELSENCLDHRDSVSVDSAVDRIEVVYDELLDGT